MSVYRRGPETHVARLRVACAACGQLASVGEAEASFRCARCDLEQETLRSDVEPRPAVVKSKHTEAGSYAELVPFTRSLGREERCSAVYVIVDGIVGAVSIEIDSGVVAGVEMWMSADGFPDAVLRDETDEEREGKKRGVTHEAQTGDDVFDDLVFIASAAPDAELRAILSPPAARRAVLRLLRGCSRIVVSVTGIKASFRKGADAFDPEKIKARLGDLRILAGALRPIDLSVVPKDRVKQAFTVAALLSITLFPVLTAVAAARWWPLGVSAPIVMLATGLALAIGLQPLVSRLARGRHDSHSTITVGRMATVSISMQATAIVLMAINALGSTAPARTLVTTIASISRDDENHATSATLAGAGPTAILAGKSITFPDREHVVAPGQRVTVVVRLGALGWEWRPRPAKVQAVDWNLGED